MAANGGEFSLDRDTRVRKIQEVAARLAQIEQIENKDPQDKKTHGLAQQIENQVYTKAINMEDYNNRIANKINTVQKFFKEESDKKTGGSSSAPPNEATSESVAPIKSGKGKKKRVQPAVPEESDKKQKTGGSSSALPNEAPTSESVEKMVNMVWIPHLKEFFLNNWSDAEANKEVEEENKTKTESIRKLEEANKELMAENKTKTEAIRKLEEENMRLQKKKSETVVQMQEFVKKLS